MIDLLRAAGAALLGLIKAQLAALLVGWDTECERIVRAVYWLGVSLIFLLFASGLFTAALLIALWEQRLWVASALSALAFALWAWSSWRWQGLLRRVP